MREGGEYKGVRKRGVGICGVLGYVGTHRAVRGVGVSGVRGMWGCEGAVGCEGHFAV